MSARAQRLYSYAVGGAGWALIFSCGVPYWKAIIAALLFGVSDEIRSRVTK